MPNVLSKGTASRKVLQKLLHYRKNSIEEITNENSDINSKNYNNLSGINSSSSLPVPPPIIEDDENETENYDFDFEYASAPRGLIDTLIM